MQYRKMGRSGLKLSVISLGGWTTFGDSINDPGTIGSILQRAYDGGINYFDIADVYGHGGAEVEMGKVLADFSRHTLVVSSKVFFPMSQDPNDRGLSRKHIHESVRASLKRVRTDYFDLYFAHRFDPEVALEEVVRAFSDLVDQGLILYWGTSEWPAGAVEEACQLARQRGWHGPAVEQPQYSLVHRQRVEGGLAPVLGEHGLGLVAFSPLGQGILTGKYDDGIGPGTRFDALPQFTKRFWNDQNLSRIKAMKEIAQDVGLTRAQLALAWLLTKPFVSCALVGATRLSQLEENLGASDSHLTSETIDRLEQLFAFTP